MSLQARLQQIKLLIDAAMNAGDTPRALRLIREQREIEQQLEGTR
jgi:hypothetical protein